MLQTIPKHPFLPRKPPMEYPAAVLEAQKSDALVHIKIQQTSIYSPSILLQFLVSLLLLAQPLMQIPSLWGAGEGVRAGTGPGARLGGHWAPQWHFQGRRGCRVPWDTWASRDPLALAFGIPFLQPSMVWFYLSCEGCGVESTWKQLDSH